ncbi:hypothetical protein COO60DRAFT_10327 [Scenedesmus sp. NREL 46B-D3]|nr:hypothetical protein COO60DRAFT_10327 [Scenedesmus sp. NREL 46B-D3]
MEAFGVTGSNNSSNGLIGGAASPAPSPAPLQPNHSSSSEHWQQQQQQQQQAAPPAGSSAMQRAASAASTGSVDAGAAAAALAGLGLPGLTDGASTRSRLGQPAGNSRTASDATRALDMSAADSMESDYFTQSMSLLCPLDDEHLPMEAANLKTRQVEVALSQLKVASLGAEDHLACLEALARLAWSDDGVRELIAHSGGVRSLVDVMALHAGSDSIQCHGCLALMSLVRGEGEVCQSNQWHIAKAGAIEVIAQAMQAFRHSAMVQLSVLLCLIPLALENAMMQAHITQECLVAIIAALDQHQGEVDIQTKGLVLLGVLIQGDDAVHDAIRIRELEAAVPRRVVAALRQHGTSNDDVLWAALFVLAVLVRDNSCVFERAKGALAWAGVMRVLQSTVDQYKHRHELENVEPDEMIVSAGDYLMHVLEPQQQQHRQQQQQQHRQKIVAAVAAGRLFPVDSVGLATHRSVVSSYMCRIDSMVGTWNFVRLLMGCLVCLP